MLSDSFGLVRQTALRNLVADDMEKRHDDRLDSSPLASGQLGIPGKQFVIVRKAFRVGAPHGNQQQEIGPVLDGRQVRRVRQIGVSP